MHRFLSPLPLLCAALMILASCTPSQSIQTGASSSQSSSAQSSSAPSRKSYHNEQYGFELTYPANWKLSDYPTNRKLYGFNIIFETSPGVYEGITVNTKTSMSVQLYVRHLKQTIITSVSDITVGGEKGKRVNTNQDGAIFIFVQHGDAMFQFQTNGDMLTKGVIDSFRFTK